MPKGRERPVPILISSCSGPLTSAISLLVVTHITTEFAFWHIYWLLSKSINRSISRGAKWNAVRPNILIYWAQPLVEQYRCAFLPRGCNKRSNHGIQFYHAFLPTVLPHSLLGRLTNTNYALRKFDIQIVEQEFWQYEISTSHLLSLNQSL